MSLFCEQVGVQGAPIREAPLGEEECDSLIGEDCPRQSNQEEVSRVHF